MIASKTNHDVSAIAVCTVFFLALCQPRLFTRGGGRFKRSYY